MPSGQYIYKNVAYLKPTKQSTDNSYLTPSSKAVDGNLTEYAATQSQINITQWWTVDLERLHTLTQIEIICNSSVNGKLFTCPSL